ncbi:MAG: C-GCAxxG-C-C family (seleno)protein [Candidatus Brocadiia bacterium]
MPVQRAIAAYRTEGLNCAQSVLRAFQQERDIPEETVQAARRFGGGRALEGRCGALHAACELAGDDATRDRLRNEFAARASSERCREIRKANAFSCEQCIELAAGLLDSAFAKVTTPR